MTGDSDKDYPLGLRILLAQVFFFAGLGIGWGMDDLSGLMVGGAMGFALALIVLIVPVALQPIFLLLELLGSCTS